MSGFKINRRLLRKWLNRAYVQLPNGDMLSMPRGPTTDVTKAVLEVFTHRFPRVPAALRVLEPGSANKVCGKDHAAAVSLQAAAADLPEVVLADVSLEQFKLVFVAVVPGCSARGRNTIERKKVLLQAASKGGLAASETYFVTAFADRSASPFRKLVSELAWGTFAWFASEPEKLLALREGQPTELPALFQY